MRNLVLTAVLAAGCSVAGFHGPTWFRHSPFAPATALAQRPGAGAAATDWTEWRGANRDGSVPNLAVPSVWPEQLMRRWTIEAGLGYATPLVVGTRVFLFSRIDDHEVMRALDAASGKEIWRMSYAAPFSMQRGAAGHGPGPKSTPVFFAGRLFSIGMTGIVTALDAASGRQLWQTAASPVATTFTTHAFSPIVEQGRVIFHVGGHNQGAVTAFDPATGAVRWSWAGDGPSYGSPVVATIDDVRQIITLTQTKLVGLDAATGSLLWERPFTNSSVTNSATPIVHGRLVVVSNGGPAVAVTVTRRNGAWSAEPAWENAEIPYRLSNAIVMDGVMVGLSTRNSGQYFGVDIATGKTLWTSDVRQAGNAAILKAGNLWFSLESDGELLVMRASRTAFDEVRRYKLADAETWTQPTFSGNRVFVKDVSTLSLWTWN